MENRTFFFSFILDPYDELQIDHLFHFIDLQSNNHQRKKKNPNLTKSSNQPGLKNHQSQEPDY